MRPLVGEQRGKRTLRRMQKVVLTSSLDIARYIRYSDRRNSFSQYGPTTTRNVDLQDLGTYRSYSAVIKIVKRHHEPPVSLYFSSFPD